MRVHRTSDRLHGRKISAGMNRYENDSYDATDIVGKTGLESVLETTLQGDKGSEYCMSTTSAMLRGIPRGARRRAATHI